jgi:hypothetical protein
MTKLDKWGNLYVCGHVMGYVNYNGVNGSSVYTQINNAHQNNAKMQGFLAKYDCSGNLIWFKTLGNASYNSYLVDLCIDTSGNAYVIGDCNYGTIDNYWSDSLFAPIMSPTPWPTNYGILLKVDKNNGSILWHWTTPFIYGSTVNINFGNVNSGIIDDNVANPSYMIIKNDTLSMLAVIDSVPPTLNSSRGAIIDFNCSTGQLISKNIMFIPNASNNMTTYGFGLSSDGNFIMGVNIASPSVTILDSTILIPNANNVVGKGMIFTFNRQHFLKKLLFVDSAGFASACDFSNPKIGFQFNGVGLKTTGEMFPNVSFKSNGKAHYGAGLTANNNALIKFNNISSFGWGINVDSSSGGSYVTVGAFDVNGSSYNPFLYGGAAKLQGVLYNIASPNFYTTAFKIDETGTITNQFSEPSTSLPNGSGHKIEFVYMNVNEKGNLYASGNIQSNDIYAGNDTAHFFGGNNDLFFINYGWRCDTVASLIPPAQCDNLHITNSNATSISLQWQDVSNVEYGYNLYRSSTSATAGFSLVVALPANTTTYTDNVPTGTYWYKVAAYNNMGDGHSCNTTNATVGISELKNNSSGLSGKIYPNPTQNGKFTLTVNSNSNEKGQLQVSNYMGQIIFDETVQLSNSNTWQFDLGNQASGTYMVSIKTATGRFAQRVMVVR